jgi:deoxycytidylate deaminase
MKDKKSVLIDFCVEQAELSKCTDKKTAAILVSEDLMQIYSIGINGGPKGGKDCLCTKGDGKQKYSCVHAEMNCLVKNRIIDNTPKIIICTKQPCAICASLIVNACTNIVEVWFMESYWDDTGLEILLNAGIKIIKLVRTSEV